MRFFCPRSTCFAFGRLVSLAQPVAVMPVIPIMNEVAIARALQRVAHEIAERHERTQDVLLLGVQTGGIHIARRLAANLEEIWKHTVPVGDLDVSMHRDDHGQSSIPSVHPTHIPCDLNGRAVVLVDDVLFSGRTTRAAMDALNDFGRPRKIQLAVLVDRGHRELPIKADFIGKNAPTSLDEHIDVQLTEDGGVDVVYLRKQ